MDARRDQPTELIAHRQIVAGFTMTRPSALSLVILLAAMYTELPGTAADTLPPLQDGIIPTTLDQLWQGFDPHRDPLNVQVCKEWDADGIICRVVRIDIGTFKGVIAKLGLLYAFPKGASRLPGLMQIHGGGQSASLDCAIADARRGYASISINWGGNRFNLGRFQGSYDGPNTDWGALDATHVPQRQKVNHFAGSLLPDDYTLDPVESPRNSNWFVVLVAARRALTFMESQPEIDAERLGVYGHSMGGKLTTNLCAIDKRVKAAVPSCGGSGDVPMEVAEQVPGAIPSTDSPLLLATISDNAYIPRITCPILWLSPTNDFHANLNHFAWTWRDVPDQLLRVSISPHLNHRHTDDHQLTQHLFFEQYLRHAFVNPTSPQLAMSLSPTSGAPLLAVTVDASLSITAVQVYYSNDPHSLTRFWRSAPTQSNGAQWTAECPISSISQPLFAYANVSYQTPARYRDIAQSPGSGNSAFFTYSSRVLVLSGQQLAAARVQATDVAHERMIDDGLRGWQDWYRLNWDHPPLWTAITRKVKDPKWRGPDGATLAVDVNPSKDCSLVVTFFANEWGAFSGRSGTYYTLHHLKGSPDWQTVRVNLADLRPIDEHSTEQLTSWQTLTQLQFSPTGSVTAKDGTRSDIGKQGWENHATLTLRNLRWDGGTYGEVVVAPAVLKSPTDFDHQFNNAIKQSLEQEKLDQQAK
jgi:dienelactone hydrolase